MGPQHRRELTAGNYPISLLQIAPLRQCHPPFPQLTGLKIFQNGMAGIDIIAPLTNGFMITSCFAFQNNMFIPSDPHSLVANNLFK
jgi:hypothetical protein